MDAFDNRYPEEALAPPNTKEGKLISGTLLAASATGTDPNDQTVDNNSSLPMDVLDDVEKSIASANRTEATVEIEDTSLSSSIEGNAGGYQSRLLADIRK